MRPRGGGGGGGFSRNLWLNANANAGLAGWFGVSSGAVGREDAGSQSAGNDAINFGVWVEGRPSKDGFIVAFQSGNPDPDARISANWMACGV